MKKFFVILVLLVATLGTSAYLFFKPKAQFEEFVEIKSDLDPLSCDLNTQNSCSINFKGQDIEFSLSPKPIYTMMPVTVRIYGLEKLNFKKPSLEIHGVNMDMGLIKADLEQRENGYVSNIVLSACLINIMRYRFEVLDGGKRSGLYIDFDLHQ